MDKQQYIISLRIWHVARPGTQVSLCRRVDMATTKGVYRVTDTKPTAGMCRFCFSAQRKEARNV